MTNSKLYILVLSIVFLLLVSFSSNPPNGKTGAPSEQLCTQCHNSGATNIQGNITLEGIPEIIKAGQAYPINIILHNTNGGALRGGFQLVALDVSNTNAGSFSNPADSSAIMSSNGRSYFEHNIKAKRIQANGKAQYQAIWTAPSENQGEKITFYLAGILANGNGDNSFDRMVTTRVETTTNTGNPPIDISISTKTDALCNGEASGSATVSIIGGNEPFDILWHNGESTLTATMLPAGIHTVIVTDALNSRDTAMVTIGEPSPLKINESTNGIIACNGDSTGKITLSPSGGSPPYSIKWENGDTTHQRTNLAAGIYNVEVKDNNDCSISKNIVIQQLPKLQLAILNVEHLSCYKDSSGSINLLVTGGKADYDILWFDGDTLEDRSGLLPGIYSVTATDANGCEASTATEVLGPGIFDIQLIESTATQCYDSNDGSATFQIIGGRQPLNFEWEDGIQTLNRNNLSSGTHSLIYSDANMCQDTLEIEIGRPDSIKITIDSIVAPLCLGDQNGSAKIIVEGGTPPYSIAGLNPESTTDNLQSGIYSITVTDSQQCKKVGSFQIPEANSLSIDVAIDENNVCGIHSFPIISISADGGIAPYQFTWFDSDTQAVRNDLSYGDYLVTIADQNGCAVVQEVQIPSIDSLSINTINISSPLCTELNSGSIEVVGVGGREPYRYLWNTGDTSALLNNYPPNSYRVTVTDKNQCTSEIELTIPLQDTVSALIVTTKDVSCFGLKDGMLSMVGTGGTGPYQFAWADGNNLPIRNNLSPGSYEISITDASGCMGTVSQTIAEPGKIKIVIDSLVPTSCFNDRNGALKLSTSGGKGDVQLIWEDGVIANMRENLVSGIYKIVARDENQCTGLLEVDIPGNTKIDIRTDSIKSPDCADMDNGFIHINPQGGVTPYTFLWNDGNQNGSRDSLSGGFYTLTVTDSLSCIATASWTLIQAQSFTTIGTIIDVSHKDSLNGAINLAVQGGNSLYDYLWNTGETTSNLTNIGIGEYRVSVTNAQGCSTQHLFILSPPDCDLSVNPTITSTSCSESQNGAINLDIQNAMGPISYEWSTGDTTTNISNLGAGNYKVTVWDSLYCSSILSDMKVTAPAVLSSSVSILSNPDCDVNVDAGSVKFATTGGSPPYRYSWMNIDTIGSQIDNLASGSYQFTITDARGCTELVDFELTIMDTIPPTANLQNITLELDRFGNLPSIDITSFDIGSSDNCGNYTITGTLPDYNCSDNITHSIPINLTDDSDNITRDTVMLTIQDFIAPQLFCAMGEIKINGCEPFIIPQPLAFDNCEIDTVIITQGLPSGSIFPQGLTLQEYMAIDKSGNTASCSFYINNPVSLTIDSIDIALNGCSQIEIDSIDIIASGENGIAGSNIVITLDTMANQYQLDIQVTDTKGCIVDSIHYFTPDYMRLEIAHLTIQDATDSHSNDGFASVELIGGTEPYSYIWIFMGDTISTSSLVGDLSPGNYLLLANDECDQTGIAFVVGSVTSTHDNELLNDIRLSPNPVTDHLRITWENQSFKNGKVELLDSQGRILSTSELQIEENKMEMSTKNLSEGLYIVRISMDNRNISYKIIKMGN